MEYQLSPAFLHVPAMQAYTFMLNVNNSELYLNYCYYVHWTILQFVKIRQHEIYNTLFIEITSKWTAAPYRQLAIYVLTTLFV